MKIRPLKIRSTNSVHETKINGGQQKIHLRKITKCIHAQKTFSVNERVGICWYSIKE